MKKNRISKQQQRLVMQLQRTTDALTRRDIADWRRAWQMAINTDNPNRQQLYDIYRDVAVDLHLSACIQQRQGFVLARSFKLTDQQGNAVPQAADVFDAPWFKQFIRLALDATYWGHSLIELGNVFYTDNGQPSLSGVTLIPRKHVIPEYHRVVTDLSQDWHAGIDYRDPLFDDWLIEVGQPDSLGLYLKAATQTIPKKNALSFWDTFAEIFGMPMRIARTTTRDKAELARMEKMMDDMGTEGWGIFQEGTSIDVVESSKGDAFQVYDKRIDRSNTELSKLVLGQTMTIEDGSSLSQSETHLQVFQNIVEDDCDGLRDIINNQLIPRLIKLGFPLHGLRFDWDYSVDYTPEQQVAFESMVLREYEVEPEYFIEKYNMPVGERRQTMPVAPPEPPQDDEDPKGNKAPKNDGKTRQQQNVRPFFD